MKISNETRRRFLVAQMFILPIDLYLFILVIQRVTNGQEFQEITALLLAINLPFFFAVYWFITKERGQQAGEPVRAIIKADASEWYNEIKATFRWIRWAWNLMCISTLFVLLATWKKLPEDLMFASVRAWQIAFLVVLAAALILKVFLFLLTALWKILRDRELRRAYVAEDE